jgi:sugar/nucleoside kinase (ribokinase family)
VRLSGRPAPGARLTGHSLDGVLAGRLGGGGANAGVALARAGHHVRLVSAVADDEDGAQAIALAQAAGLDIGLVQRRLGVSRRTLIFIDPTGERLVLSLDPEPLVLASLPLPAGEEIEGLYVRAPYPGAAAWAEACRGPVVAHWPCPGFAGPCDVVVGSADDCDAATLADPFGAGRALVGPRLSAFIVTDGAGAVVAHGERGELRIEPPLAPVLDATGAGDVFAAGLLDALVHGAGLEQALVCACVWGAIAVGLDSSAPIDGVFPAFRPSAPSASGRGCRGRPRRACRAR